MTPRSSNFDSEALKIEKFTAIGSRYTSHTQETVNEATAERYITPTLTPEHRHGENRMKKCIGGCTCGIFLKDVCSFMCIPLSFSKTLPSSSSSNRLNLLNSKILCLDPTKSFFAIVIHSISALLLPSVSAAQHHQGFVGCE